MLFGRCFILSIIISFKCRSLISERISENANVEIIEVYKNASVNMTCPSQNKKVVWNKENSMLYNEPVLILKNLSIASSGKYLCYAEDGSLIKMFKLGVFHEPYFTQPKRMNHLTVKPAGNYLKLSCKAKGYPTPKIKWLKDDKEIKRTLGEVKLNEWSLVIEDLIIKDTGKYICIVRNSLKSINFTYDVQIVERFPSKPYIKDGYPKNVTAIVNSNVLFECPQVLTDLEPFIEWYWFPENCTFQYSLYTDPLLINSSCKQPKNILGNLEILELFNVTCISEGWYFCISSNSLGTTTSAGFLKVIEKEYRSTINFVIAVVLIIIVLFFVILFTYCRKKIIENKRKAIEDVRVELTAEITAYWTKKIVIHQPKSDSTLLPIVKIKKQIITLINKSSPNRIFEYELPLDQVWEIPRETLFLGNPLGEGAFGKVVKGKLVNHLEQGTQHIVAVKMLKDVSGDDEMVDLVSEMEIMKAIGNHPNIIRLVGCCTQAGPLFIVMEFALYGNLRNFLQKYKTLDQLQTPVNMVLYIKHLVLFAFQVAKGMEYLSIKKCLHRDLAARNVLLTEDMSVKISDFGLARDVQFKEYYRKARGGLLPIKWMAPEAIFSKMYTIKSDVWSFGILFYEIMTLGGDPYPDINNNIEKLLHLLETGYKMEKPLNCTAEVYLIMHNCWEYDPIQRPTFTQLVQNLDEILKSVVNQEYFESNSKMN